MIRHPLIAGVLLMLLTTSPRAIAAMYADQGAAYAACMAAIAKGTAAWQPMRCRESKSSDGSGNYAAWDKNGRDVGWQWFSWSKDKSCDKRPDESGWQGGETAATVNVCHTGCMYSSSLDPSSPSGFTYYPTGGACTEADAPAPTPAGDGGDPGEGGGGDGGGTDPGGGDGGGDNGGGDGGAAPIPAVVTAMEAGAPDRATAMAGMAVAVAALVPDRVPATVMVMGTAPGSRAAMVMRCMSRKARPSRSFMTTSPSG
ncbi:hypothetical protein [Stenotrophomonas geniculata]